MVDSACQLPTICTPIGMPSWLVPNRLDTPGKPVTLDGAVADMIPMMFTVWPLPLDPMIEQGKGSMGAFPWQLLMRYAFRISFLNHLKNHLFDSTPIGSLQ
jgi:hypothetical protein